MGGPACPIARIHWGTIRGVWTRRGLGFIKALFSGREPDYTTFGTAYMLMGDSPISNTNPAATEKTTDAD